MAAVEIGPGTRVLVTGASRGIGEAIARAFAARGCTLGLVARRSEPLAQLAGELPGDGHAAIPGDVTDRRLDDQGRGAVRRRGRARGQRRDHPLPAVRAAPAGRGAPDERRELARDDPHRVGGAPADARARPRPHRGGVVRRRRARVPVGRGLQRHQGRAARLRGGAAPGAAWQRRVGHDGLPGRDRDLAARPRAGPHAGLVPNGPPRPRRAARGTGGEGRGERPPRALLPAGRARAESGERHLAAARRPHAAADPRQGASPPDEPAAEATAEAAARPFREGAARGRGLALRAQVRRLPDDRVPRRRRRPAPEPQRQGR